MRAKHVMVSSVNTGKANMTVREFAKILAENRISAIPIIDDYGKVIGIISEGDLIRRTEIGTQKQRSWWLSLFTSNVQLAEEYARAHARKVLDLMTHEIIFVEPDTPLSEIARLLEFHRIKQVPVLDDGKFVGIVSRSNLVQAIATAPQKEPRPLSDDQIRNEIQKSLESQSWANSATINVTVYNGTVNLWGLVRSEAERTALRIASEDIAGVRAVNDHLALEPLPTWV